MNHGTPENAIFICYRRDDSNSAAYGIYQRLKVAFGERAVFLDHHGFQGGDEWREKTRPIIQQARAEKFQNVPPPGTIPGPLAGHKGGSRRECCWTRRSAEIWTVASDHGVGLHVVGFGFRGPALFSRTTDGGVS